MSSRYRRYDHRIKNMKNGNQDQSNSMQRYNGIPLASSDQACKESAKLNMPNRFIIL